MWLLKVLCTPDVTLLFLSITLCVTVCHQVGAISIHAPQRSLSRSIQEDVLFSVEVTCRGIPTIRWTFMSGLVSRGIGTWMPGVYTNITMDYTDRVHTYINGSMALSDLRLQDAGFYVLTVTETAGSSKDAGFVLKVNEVLYEDLQYLTVSAVVMAGMAVILMLTMWLLNKAYGRIKASRRRQRMQENDKTELQLRQLR